MNGRGDPRDALRLRSGQALGHLAGGTPLVPRVETSLLYPRQRAWSYVPVPVSAVVCGLPAPVSVTLSVPVTVPFCVGKKATLI